MSSGKISGMSLRLLRTIRLDPSDQFVFPNAAEPGQWAVSGAFMFPDDPEGLSQKARVALRSGLLGIEDLGWSTLAVVVAASDEERANAIEALARRFVEHLGAPSIDVAREAAQEEIAFAQSLADHPEGTLIAVHRAYENGQLTERFRTLTRRQAAAGAPLSPERVFQFVETQESEESVDLAAMLARSPSPKTPSP